jgi:hypothetical protein
MYRELLLGCGYRRERLVDPYTWSENFALSGEPPENRWSNVVTVDINSRCGADYWMDLRCTTTGWQLPAPEQPKPGDEALFESKPHRFSDHVFDEVHAYEVLEHLGQQGDERAFFTHFSEIWHILKVGGFLCATVPSRYSQWLWGDPGHRRAILPASLVFLSQAHYERQVGRGPSSDYRPIYDGNFHIVHSSDNEETHTFVLQALPAAVKSV